MRNTIWEVGNVSPPYKCQGGGASGTYILKKAIFTPVVWDEVASWHDQS